MPNLLIYIYIPSLCKEFIAMRHNIGHSSTNWWCVAEPVLILFGLVVYHNGASLFEIEFIFYVCISLNFTRYQISFNWQYQLMVQVILFEIDCAIFKTNLHELFCQFISWTNWVNSGKFMDNCWMSCQVMADMEKFYDDLIIADLYR